MMMDKFYAENVCFVTGSTGFVGKVLVEKMLRWQPEGPPIYLLIRARKDTSAAERLQREIVESPIFDRLKQEIGQEAFVAAVARRLRAVEGDLIQENLGIAPQEYDRLKREVSVVLHVAASVDFNADLATATRINILAALRVQRVSKDWDCIAHVHVSTAYVNCNRLHPSQKAVDEKIYDLGFDPEPVVKEIQTNYGPGGSKENDLVSLNALKGSIQGAHPNTYTLTKSMAENMLVKNRGDQSLAIVRPSIIGAAWQEPVPGWVDSVSAAGAVFVVVGLGLLQIMPGSKDTIADMVPVDTVVKHILVAAARIAHTHDLDVLHATTSANKNTLAWGITGWRVSHFFGQQKPSRQIRKPKFRFVPSKPHFRAEWALRYTIPAFLFTNVCKLVGTQNLVKKGSKVERAVRKCNLIMGLFSHFTSNEWIFKSDKLSNWQRRGSSNQQLQQQSDEFNLCTEQIHWPQYIEDFCYGLSLYMLKEKKVVRSNVRADGDVILAKMPAQRFDSAVNFMSNTSVALSVALSVCFITTLVLVNFF